MEVMPTLMTTNNILVISHQAVLRCLVNFLRKKDMKNMPYEKIPLHTLFKVNENIKYKKTPHKKQFIEFWTLRNSNTSILFS